MVTLRGDHPGGRHHGALGRPVVVDHGERETLQRAPVESLRPGQQRPQRGPLRPVRVHQLLGEQRRGERDRDLLGDQPVAQHLRRTVGLLVRDVQRRAGRQRRPGLPHRRVEPQPGDLRGPVPGRDVERRHMPVHEVREVRVGDLHTLRATRAARGVDHVRQILRAGGGVLRRPRARGRATGLVQVEDAPGSPGYAARAVVVGQHDRHPGVAEDVLHPVGGRGGVERQVGGPGLQHRQRGDHVARRAGEHDTHARSRPGARGAQGRRQPVGLVVELPVGHPHVRRHDGGALRGAPGQVGDARRHRHERPGSGARRQDGFTDARAHRTSVPHVRLIVGPAPRCALRRAWFRDK